MEAERTHEANVKADNVSSIKTDPRILKVEQLLVHHPLFKQCLERLEKCFRLSGVTTEPLCLAIVGNSGVGKTTIMNKFQQRHPSQNHKKGMEVPVLVASVPSKPTVNKLAQTLLYELGDPLYKKGNAEEKTVRLIEFIRHCGVQMILLDEFQHFVDKVSRNIPHEVADWLKRFIDQARTSVCVFGLPRCIEVFKLNEQLRRRFTARLTLKAFGWQTEAERTEFRAFLFALEKELPVPASQSLATIDMAYRFYYASAGYPGYIMKIIRGAVYEAVDLGANTLDLALFCASFQDYVWNDVDCPENPFTDLFSVDAERCSRPVALAHETSNRMTPKRIKKTKLSEVLRS